MQYKRVGDIVVCQRGHLLTKETTVQSGQRKKCRECTNHRQMIMMRQRRGLPDVKMPPKTFPSPMSLHYLYKHIPNNATMTFEEFQMMLIRKQQQNRQTRRLPE